MIAESPSPFPIPTSLPWRFFLKTLQMPLMNDNPPPQAGDAPKALNPAQPGHRSRAAAAKLIRTTR
jgi:hypothetical protein